MTYAELVWKLVEQLIEEKQKNVKAANASNKQEED